MDLSVVIVNWKVKVLLRQCLASIYRETRDLDFDVWVVDNDSRDGSVEMVRAEFPQARLIANEHNLGFAAANNQAIHESRADFVLLLNPDTEIRENAFAKLVTYARANPRIGVVGPRLLNPDGSLQPSVRHFPTLASQLLILFKLHHLWPGLPAFRHYLAADFDYDRAQPCDQVMGAAFLISRKLLDRVGPLDERYFVWFEEVDYCRAARRAGFEVAYWPGAQVVHHGAESFGQLFGPRRQRLFNDSLRKYFLKNHGRAAWLALTIAHPLSMFLAWVAEAAAGRRQKSKITKKS